MAPDYASLIDAETWAFIRRTDSFYPPDAVELSVAEQRAVYDRMCSAFAQARPEGVTASDEAIPAEGHTIPVRLYSRADADGRALVLYFHGGGFVVGGLESHDDVCAELCARTGYDVVSVDYRLSPEHVHPAAFDDACSAFAWAGERFGRPIVLCGDSAGGNLAAAVAHRTRHGPHPAIGQVLIYPGLGGDRSTGSHRAHAEAPMLSARDVAYYSHVRSGAADVSDDPTFAPLRDTDFSALPPTVVVTAECDPLSSDGEAYCAKLRAAGGRARWIEEEGLVHGYLRARHSVARASASFGRIVEAVATLGRGGRNS